MTHSSLAPCEANDFLLPHVLQMLSCYQKLTGKTLLPEETPQNTVAQTLYNAPFVVLSHNADSDPIFTYGNLAAQQLFEMSWAELTALPSRYSAEAPNREERARLLKLVTEQGYIDSYEGIRISRTGKRFLVRNALVWNLFEPSGQRSGQAATFSDWTFLQNP